MNEIVKQRGKDKEDQLAREIGQRILEARSGLGWSQQAMHSRTKLHDQEGLGISRAVLSLYETGVNKPGAREIRILCETLKITPNWLLFGVDSPAKTLQPSMDFLLGDEITVSVRLAFGLLALAPQERDALASLLFSLLSKNLGDIQLSMLMTMANVMAVDMHKQILDTVGPGANELPLRDLVLKFVDIISSEGYSNYGNLRPVISEDQAHDFDPRNPPPARELKDSKP